MTDDHSARVLFSIEGVSAFHIQNGEKQSLTPSGSQTLSLLMVPTDSAYAPASIEKTQSQTLEQDFYLHLSLPPELELPLPATTQIFPQSRNSYLIPRTDLGEDGAFTSIEFPAIGQGSGDVTQEDIDTFETILAQCTAFLEQAPPPKPDRPLPQYEPADYKQGGKYHDENRHGQIVLVDEENGSVVGELAEGANVIEHESLEPGSKLPVEIEISEDGKRVNVRPVSEEYLRLSRMPQYQKSTIVQNAAAASRLIVTSSAYLGNMMTQGADRFTQTSKPAQKPMEFKPATHDRARKINALTQNAAGMSSKAVGQVARVAQNIGAGVARRKDKQTDQPQRAGLLNKSLIAFTTLVDGVAESGKTLLTQSGAAASTMVGHKYGDQAGSIATQLAGGVRNVGLVYIDVTGVTRRAVVKSVAKGMVVGKMKDGQQVVVGEGDGGEVSRADLKAAEAAQEAGQKKSEGPAPPAYQRGYYGQGPAGGRPQEKGL